MSIVVVMVRKARVAQQGSHTYKYQGGVLNTSCQRGRGYYVRRVNGQSQDMLYAQLTEIAHKV